MSDTKPVTTEIIDHFVSLFEDYTGDDEWIHNHISIVFDDVETAVTIKIWDMDDNDYKRLKKEVMSP